MNEIIDRICADVLTITAIKVERKDPVVAAAIIQMRFLEEQTAINKMQRIEQDNELLRQLEEKTLSLEKSLKAINDVRAMIAIEAVQNAQKQNNQKIFDSLEKAMKLFQIGLVFVGVMFVFIGVDIILSIFK